MSASLELESTVAKRHQRLGADNGLCIRMLVLDGQRVRVATRCGTASDHGAPPLLMFNGIGANLELAAGFLDELDAHKSVIFDIPGTGDSPAPRWPYRLSGMARMTASLLDALGYSQVDVLGVSWGGGLAQQFALDYPRRVRRMVLAATGFGLGMLPGRPSILLRMVDPRRYTDRSYMARIAPDIYGGDMRAHPQTLRLLTDHARGGSRRGYRWQMLATAGWSSLPWLWRIRQPTLVLAGSDDPLVPVLNARLHAALLPRAQLEVLPQGGHLFLLTRAAETARTVRRFLDDQNTDTGRQPSAPGNNR